MLYYCLIYKLKDNLNWHQLDRDGGKGRCHQAVMTASK